MYSSTVTSTQTAEPFNMVEFCKQNEREYMSLGIPVYDLTVRSFCRFCYITPAHHSLAQLQAETLNTHLSSIFQCTEHIRARITPFTSMYFLDFVDNSGVRIDKRTDLDIFDGEKGDEGYHQMKPLGSDYNAPCKLQIYILHSARSYEIRSHHQLLKTIKFPARVIRTVQCS